MVYNNPIFTKIAEALLVEYTSVYYINAKTNEYEWYSTDAEFQSLHIEQGGKDFFKNLKRDADKVIYEEDKHIFMQDIQKEKLLSLVSKGAKRRIEYRLMIDGKPVYHALSLIRGIGDTDDYFILGVKNVDKEVRDRQQAEKSENERRIYNQIVESLALRYDIIYYVNAENGEYSRNSSGAVEVDPSLHFDGKNFFNEAIKVVNTQIHPEDKERIKAVIDRDYIITALANNKQYSADYRYVFTGTIKHMRLTVMRSNDNVHFIIGLENIDEEVKKEQEQIEALNRANELARRDVLTGTRNMTAYREFEDSIQKSIDNGMGHSPFAIVICDINDLKHINDTKGHKAGDEYIRSSCRMICSIFAHSPVFRIGGDEFAAVLVGNDYDKRISLVEMLRSRSYENYIKNSGSVVAVGIGVYDKVNDNKVSDVFKRADEAMYQDKLFLKEGKPFTADESQPEHHTQITAERKRVLDGMFEMNCISADGMYVYICDMKSDYSRWSKEAVDSYGLPSEYMYGAGAIWEEHIHEEDKEAYHSGIANIFAGNLSGHDMQYRARRINGEYNVCTCRGIVLKDENGEPDFFVGTIRDHGVQSNIDSLTGLKNQYGFFDEIQSNIIKNRKMRISLIGIAKFSEINEIYGYHFGNLVIQKFARYLFEHVESSGTVYRLDGTKFAVMSTSLSVEESKSRYEDLRSYYRESIMIDDKRIMLELNSSLIEIDNFNIDSQTVMTCLTFAYNESKTQKHGDLVLFNNSLGRGNKHKVEKFHAIRASITRDFAGFYLMYQPVVDAQTEKLIGAEALLRWKSEEYGIVPPDQFIPLLEQDPIFPSLGEWILTTAVTDAGKILKSDPDFIINVNLSYSQIEKADFVDMVMDILDKTGFPADHLCLEITERCRLLDIDLIRNIVCSLKSRGVKVALDDFGTGFSSVGIVKDLPFDTIKIDRSLVRNIETDTKEREMLKIFVMMADTCGSAVCVEGIENTYMAEILRRYDVHSFQGYFYSKPLEYGDFLKWRKERTV